MHLAVGGQTKGAFDPLGIIRRAAPPGDRGEGLVITREDSSPQAPPAGTSRPAARLRDGLIDKLLDNPALFMAGLLLAMWLILSRLSPYFFTLDNLFEITIQAAVIALIAVGQTFVILSGGIDLSVGAVLAATSVVASID